MKKGFTLIEMLVVVLIIGILAAIAIPQYNKTVWKSRFTQAKIVATAVANAEEIFYMVNGRYTGDLEELDVELSPYKTSSVFSADEAMIYHYDWGELLIVYNGEQKDAQTFIYKNNAWYLSYTVLFSSSTFLTYKKACIAYGPSRKPIVSDINYQICQQETNNETPEEWGTYSLYWIYR